MSGSTRDFFFFFFSCCFIFCSPFWLCSQGYRGRGEGDRRRQGHLGQQRFHRVSSNILGCCCRSSFMCRRPGVAGGGRTVVGVLGAAVPVAAVVVNSVEMNAVILSISPIACSGFSQTGIKNFVLPEFFQADERRGACISAAIDICRSFVHGSLLLQRAEGRAVAAQHLAARPT